VSKLRHIRIIEIYVMAVAERRLVFYDTETTGTNIEFDQIIQFAAVLTDENFKELDRINVKSRRLPWIIPSPVAMIVTGTSPSQIDNPDLPQFPEMMTLLHRKLKSWSPARFIGYNSFYFDEPILQRALWQTLFPPYLTVTHGNARADVLPLVRATSRITPHALSVPTIASGRPVFRLDRLAPLNGYAHTNAHDALGDVLAVIHICKRIATRSSALWATFLDCSDRRFITGLVNSEEPIFFAEPTGSGHPGWWGLVIGFDNRQKSTKLVARLSADWRKFLSEAPSLQEELITRPPFQFRRVKENMFPIAFSQHDAKELIGITPSKNVSEQAGFLAAPSRKAHLVKLASNVRTEWPEPRALEQRIFEGFPSKTDEAVMRDFAALPWKERVPLIAKFEDPRLQQIAQRLVFLMAPDSLPEANKSRLTQSIRERLLASHSDNPPWRTIDLARLELDELRNSSANERAVSEMEEWLVSLQNSLSTGDLAGSSGVRL
jgi:exodeoxyribonuclease I